MENNMIIYRYKQTTSNTHKRKGEYIMFLSGKELFMYWLNKVATLALMTATVFAMIFMMMMMVVMS